MTADKYLARPARIGRADIDPPGSHPERTARITGRQFGLGIAVGVGLAVLMSAITVLIARAAAPGWARTDGLTVLIVAEVYLAVIAGLVIGAGGPRAAGPLLALRMPTARQLGFGFAWMFAAAAAGLAVSVAFSPLSGGPAATLEAIVRDASDETRMPTATPLVWALIVIRLLLLTGTAEELFFRGALYGWLRRRLAVPATIAIVTAAFILEHSFYPILIPVVAAMGLAAAWVRHRTHSVGVTIPLHVAVDFAIFFAAMALA